MALTYSVWEIRSGGADTNGGGEVFIFLGALSSMMAQATDAGVYSIAAKISVNKNTPIGA